MKPKTLSIVKWSHISSRSWCSCKWWFP